MITLTSLSKIYRTNEIETVALENVNLKAVSENDACDDSNRPSQEPLVPVYDVRKKLYGDTTREVPHYGFA